ncbi:MAG: ribonuclease H-like domain-containing protein [Lachnospiraceae bacterium]|nr:ribonuclease H-like domain-containing protein [Lachnospiraceae bacterium]
MKTFEYIYDGLEPLDNLTNLTCKDDILFFDIETTGLSRSKNHIYLIGIGHYIDKGLKIIQWIADSETEELLILKEFISYSSSFATLVNYNGKSFDIPFTKERLNKYNLIMPELSSIDIYTYIKPLRKILSLNDLTQKTIEQFLGIKREDKYNGGELIKVYKQYEVANDNELLSLLLLHNKEDVKNMHYLTKMLDYTSLNNLTVNFYHVEINEYTDYNNILKKEYIIHGLHNLNNITKGFNTFKSSEYGSLLMSFSSNGDISIRIPIFEGTLYYYIDNYKDYYYLPYEDICILKTMAGGVLKENKMNATKETCKIKLSTSFIPFFGTDDECFSVRLFKDGFKSKNTFIRTEDFINMSDEQKSMYLNSIYQYLFI